MKTALLSIPPHHARALSLLQDLSTRPIRRKMTPWEASFLSSLQASVAKGNTVTRRQWDCLRGLHERVL